MNKASIGRLFAKGIGIMLNSNLTKQISETSNVECFRLNDTSISSYTIREISDFCYHDPLSIMKRLINRPEIIS